MIPDSGVRKFGRASRRANEPRSRHLRLSLPGFRTRIYGNLPWPLDRGLRLQSGSSSTTRPRFRRDIKGPCQAAKAVAWIPHHSVLTAFEDFRVRIIQRCVVEARFRKFQSPKSPKRVSKTLGEWVSGKLKTFVISYEVLEYRYMTRLC